MQKLQLEELGRLTLEQYKSIEKIPIIVVLDNIRSAVNVGSIFRTCDAFAIEKIILCGITPTPPNREIFKTAIGATDSVAWEYHESIIETINQFANDNAYCIAIEQTTSSIDLRTFSPIINQKLVVIFGNEVDGVHDEVVTKVHKCIEIPQFGTKHSLNVSVCAGIVLHHISAIYRSMLN